MIPTIREKFVRLIVAFDNLTPGSLLPWNYQNGIRRMFYEAITNKDEEFAQKLHDGELGEVKLFCFNQLKGLHMNGQHLETKPILFLEIAGDREILINYFLEGLKENNFVFYNTILRVREVAEHLPQPNTDFYGTICVKKNAYLDSPVYLHPSDKLWSDLIINRMQLKVGIKPDKGVIVPNLEVKPKPKLINIKGTKIKGYVTRVKIHDEAISVLAQYIGLGNDTTSGFGYLTAK